MFHAANISHITEYCWADYIDIHCQPVTNLDPKKGLAKKVRNLIKLLISTDFEEQLQSIFISIKQT